MSHTSFCRSRTWAVILLALILTLTLATPALAQGPVLIGTDPLTNTVGAPLDTNVSATFDATIDTTTVTSQTFAVHSLQSGLVTGTYSFADSDTTVTLNPAEDFFPGETVHTSLTSGITNGANPITPYQWQFTAGDVTNRCVNGFEQDVLNSDTFVDLKYSTAAWADYDLDGWLDLMLTGNDGTSVSSKLYHNLEGSGFAEVFAGAFTPVQYAGVAWGDYDNDGDPDLLLAGREQSGTVSTRLYRNDREAGFAEVFSSTMTGLYLGQAAWGDYDNDGWLDLAISGNRSGTASDVTMLLYRNNAGAGFTSVTSTAFQSLSNTTLAWADYDNDGWLDLLHTGHYVASSVGKTFLYHNNGGFSFSRVDVSISGYKWTVGAWGDYDKDSYPDILLTLRPSTGTAFKSTILHNLGGLAFTPVMTDTITPVINDSLAWGDYDNDGWLDILASGVSSSITYVSKVFHNSGGTGFSEVFAGSLPGAEYGKSTWVDYDNDGDLDILITGAMNGGGTPLTVLYTNEDCPPTLIAHSPLTNTVTAPLDSSVVLTFSANIDAATVTSRTVAIHSMMRGLVTETHSVNGNVVTVNPPRDFFPGELVYAIATTQTTDITGTHPLTATQWQFTTAVSQGWGHFNNTPVNFGNYDVVKSVAWGDFDNDGDLDLASGNYDSLNLVYRNNGDGSFGATPVNVGSGTDKTYSIDWGDFDNDGDLDLAVANHLAPSVVHLNNGDGSFGATVDIDSGNNSILILTWGDYDNDGDLDLATGKNGQNAIYPNNGNGTFGAAVKIGPSSGNTWGLAWGDFDNDGDLDLAVGNYSGQNAVYPNNGDGSFGTAVNFGTSNDATHNGLAWGDFDDDGDLDLAVGNWGEQNAVYTNNGDGSFGTAVNFGTSTDATASLAWGDFDDDGDLDLAVGNYSWEQNAVYPNNGNGTFGAAVNFGAASNTWNLAWGDFDGDGDLDIAAANKDVWLNEPSPDVTIVKTVTPATAKPGDSITYTLTYSNAGSASATGVVITDSVPLTVTNPTVVGNSGAVITPTGTAPNFAWDVANLSQNEGGVITLTGILSEPITAGIFTNTAEIACADDGDAGNNTSAIGVSHCGNRITVTSTADGGPGTLRQAIIDICDGGVIDFNLIYPATIPTNGNDYSFYKPLTINGPGPENLTIQGPGDSESVFYIEDLNATDVVTLSGMTIRDGYYDYGGGIYMYDSYGTLIVSNTHILENEAYEGDGGGIWVDDDGTLIVHSSVISGNFTEDDGGGIYMREDTVLTVTNSIISNNIVDGDSYGGGGISLYYATSAYITGTTISGNETYYNGGGITAHETDWVTVINSVISDNRSEDEGGGIFSDDGPLTVISTTITGNSNTDDDGGGIYSEGPLIVNSSVISGNHTNDDGGGIASEDDLTITNSIISYNTADGSSYGGGGLFMYDGDATITGTTISHNRVTSGGDDGGGIATNDSYNQALTLINSSITGNYADDGGGGLKLDDVTAVFSNTIISGNEADNGGGLQISYGSDVTITGCTFSGNSATDGYGGGIYNDESDNLVISATNFISNTTEDADSGGGAIYTDYPLIVNNSRFIGNSAYDWGGAIMSFDATAIANSLFADNGVKGGGSVIAFEASSATLALTHTTIASATLGSGPAIEVVTGTLNAVNNLIANYTTGISSSGTVNEDYNLFAGNSTDRVGVTPGTHSWSSSNFSGAGFVNAAGGDFHLTSSSWALNKGTDAGIATDYDGDARPGGGGFDLGYDETTHTGPTAVDDPNETVIENRTLTISPLTNDTATDGDTLHVGAVGSPAHGTATISGTTQIVYTPTTNYTGTDVFTYTAREASQLQDTATITVTVTPNTAPVAAAGSNQSVAQGGSVQLDGSGSSDANGDALTYGWVQTGGSPSVMLSSRSAISPTFTAPNEETVLTFTLTVTDTGGLTDTSTVVVTVDDISDIYLPLIFKGFAMAPDLVVESFAPTSSGITIIIRNEGNMPITENFWVDVYFDPTETPTLNHEWETIAAHGAVWGVTDNIPVGSTLTLTVGDKYYYANESSNPPFPVGVPAYTYIDSINYNTDYGNIRELDETDNLFGPVISTAGADAILPLNGEAPSAAELPGRK